MPADRAQGSGEEEERASEGGVGGGGEEGAVGVAGREMRCEKADREEERRRRKGPCQEAMGVFELNGFTLRSEVADAELGFLMMTGQNETYIRYWCNFEGILDERKMNRFGAESNSAKISL